MSETHQFDAATMLRATGPRHWSGDTSPDYKNMVGPFGGVIAATMLRAVLDDEDAQGDPVALTVNFCAAMDYAPFSITTKLLRTGKHAQNWSLELVQNDEIKAAATVLMGVRRETFTHQPAAMPNAPAPDAVEPLDAFARDTWVNTYDMRFVSAKPSLADPPHDPPAPAQTILWVKDKIDRPLDYLSLAALSDCFFFRMLHVRGIFLPTGTVSLTTYFHATRDELAEQGAAHVLGVADTKRFHANFHDQDMQLWSRSGKLLASGVQTVWYKE